MNHELFDFSCLISYFYNNKKISLKVTDTVTCKKQDCINL